MKKLNLLFTALLLMCCLGTAKAERLTIDGIKYDVNTDTKQATVISNWEDGYYSGDIVIPSEITYNNVTCSVTSIGEYAFLECSGLTSVTIGNSVTSIGYCAFSGCSGLTSVTIGNGVTSIGRSAFSGCSGLESIVVDPGNTKYDSRENCNAIIETESNTLIAGCKNSVIPNSVTSIGQYAFSGCSGLTSITIPNSVTSIGNSAFGQCSGLESIVVDPGNTKYDSRENCNAIIETESNTLITGCKKTVIPNSVTSIGELAFGACSGLTSITIPNSITSIEELAFAYCSGLKSVTIGNSVTSIGEGAFGACSGLTSVIIGNSVTSIGQEAFAECSGLTSITIPNSVTSIGDWAFYECSGLKTVYNLSNLTFSEGSSSNGSIAYYADNVYNITNGSIEGDYIFGKPNNVNTLVGYLGSEAELTLPADYKGESYVIGENVFKDNKTITSITIPNSVTSIGEWAFAWCSGLKSVTIGNSVTSIGEWAFYYCSGLKKVHINDLAAWCNIDFESSSANPLYYAHNLYLNNELVTELVIPNGVTSIGYRAFQDCDGLTSITIPNSVTSIGNNAFSGCSGLTSITIPNSVTSIGESAFANCDNITDIKVMAEKPIRSNANIFSNAVYDNATLYIPAGTKSLYEKREPWNMFFYMQEIDNTGIEDIRAENGNIKAIYDLQGRRVENPTNGIYIINGKKIFIK